MRHDSVIIKSNAYGLILILNADIPFDQLLSDIGAKFRDAAKFFRNAQMALTFRGRVLSPEEEAEIVRVITSNAQIQILCIVDEDKEHSDYYKDAITRSTSENKDSARIYRGTLRTGQTLEAQESIVILGDVNPGASVTSGGDIIILGCCMGQVNAGAPGRNDCFVAALTLLPNTLRIGTHAARSAITKREDTGDYPINPQIAVVRDEHLIKEKLKGASFAALAASMTEKE